jgi:hypothetical protein
MSYNFPRTYVLLSKQAASASNTIDFNSVITSNFKTYLVALRNVVSGTNNVTFQCLFSTNNGSSYLGSAYGWSNTFVPAGSTKSTNGNASTDTSITIVGAISSTASRALSGDLIFFELGSGVLQPRYMGTVAYDNQAGANETFLTMGMNTGVTAVNAIRFQMSSGTIASGTFTLYGVSEP